MPKKTNLLVDALPLLFICFTAVLGIYALGQFLEDNITRNQHLPILEIGAEVLPLEHDNDLPTDRLSVDMPTYFGTVAATDVYRVPPRRRTRGRHIQPRARQGLQRHDGTGRRRPIRRDPGRCQDPAAPGNAGPGRPGPPGQFALDTGLQRSFPGQHA